jgi:peptidoglycan/LPS O-acetylase OafA/YrhL
MTASAPRRPHYKSLDAWRGIACLSIVIYHTVGPFPPRGLSVPIGLLYELGRVMGFAVTLFFVISGYCIAATADKTQRVGLSWRDYFWRRFKRIFPPLWAFFAGSWVAVTVAYGLGFGPLLFGHHHGEFTTIVTPSSLRPLQWLGNLTLSEGWRGHVVWAGGAGWWQGHTWSLGYEEQFYVVVGALLLVAKERWLIAAGLLSAVVVGITVATRTISPSPFAGFFFDGGWLLFAYGLALYYHRNYAIGIQRWLLPAFGLIGIVWGSHVGQPHFVVAASFSLALGLLENWDEQIARMRAVSPLTWCGKRCYSIYLIHWPVTKAVSGVGLALGLFTPFTTLMALVPLSLVFSVSLAYPFHKFVEQRFLNTPRATLRSKIAATSQPPQEAMRLSGV